MLAFGEVKERDGSPYTADMRSRLKGLTDRLFAKDGTIAHASNEIEGFLFKGRDAERQYHLTGSFEFISTGGYYHSLPGDALRRFIDNAAEAQRALGFGNEKDHPEVAPSQFEMNYSLHRGVHRRRPGAALQAHLPPGGPAARHDGVVSCRSRSPASTAAACTRTCRSRATARTCSTRRRARTACRTVGWNFIDRILANANDICLILNSSVNSYRRLDPHFEAPNQIKASAINRGAMVRIPLGNEKSARVEVRSIAPDANPYLAIYALLRTGLEGPLPADAETEIRRSRTRFLPDNIYDAIRHFKASDYVTELLGDDVQAKFAEVKQTPGRPLPEGARLGHQDLRGPVPPRGDEPVSVEQVLEEEARSQKGPLTIVRSQKPAGLHSGPGASARQRSATQPLNLFALRRLRRQALQQRLGFL